MMKMTTPFTLRLPASVPMRAAFHAALLVAGASLGAGAQAPDSLTLGGALAQGRARRPAYAVAAAVVERAEGARQLAAAIPNPNAQYERDQQSPRNKLTVVQPLAWLPRRGADLAQGRALLERGRADSAELVREAERGIRRAFYGALAADALRSIAREQETLADSLVRLADRRVRAGDISELERDQVAQEAARARLATWRAREDAAAAALALRAAIAWDAVALPPLAGRLDEGLDGALRDTMPDGDAALGAIPAVRAAIADSAAAAARLRSARIGRIPIPALVVGREWERGATGNAVLGASVPLPLFNLGGDAATQARGAAEELAARVADVRLTRSAQLASSRMRLAEASSRARFARDSLLPEGRRLRAGAIRLYDAGRTGVYPVLDALRTERELAATITRELLAFQEARADLVALLGPLP
jgi:outer membrane protein TolC